MNARQDFIIGCALEATRKHVDDHTATASTCILSTNVLLRVLDYFEIPARPEKFETAVLNEVAKDWVVAERDMSDDGAACAAAGGWVVQIDTENDDGSGYPGHLAVVTDDLALLDASLRQFHRPARGIHVPSTEAFQLAPSWRDQPSVFPLGDAWALYVHRPDIRDYGYSPDWGADRGRRLAALAIRDIKRVVRLADLSLDRING